MPSYYNDLYNEEQDWSDVILNRPNKIDIKNNSDESIKLHFGNYILKERIRNQISQTDFAQKLNIKLSILQQYEDGDIVPPKRIITRINNICNCNLFIYV